MLPILVALPPVVPRAPFASFPGAPAVAAEIAPAVADEIPSAVAAVAVLLDAVVIVAAPSPRFHQFCWVFSLVVVGALLDVPLPVPLLPPGDGAVAAVVVSPRPVAAAVAVELAGHAVRVPAAAVAAWLLCHSDAVARLASAAPAPAAAVFSSSPSCLFPLALPHCLAVVAAVVAVALALVVALVVASFAFFSVAPPLLVPVPPFLSPFRRVVVLVVLVLVAAAALDPVGVVLPSAAAVRAVFVVPARLLAVAVAPVHFPL